MGNANLVAPPTEAQKVAIQVTFMVAALPSIIGATFIVQHIARSSVRRKLPGTSIVLGMSLMDLLYAGISIFGTVVNPKNTVRQDEWARGNWASCEAAGFLGHGAMVASVLYNVSLTVYYLLTIRYGWSDRKIQNKVLKWLHVLPLLVGWGLAVPGLPLELYNPTPMGCRVEGYPPFCAQMGSCERGINAKTFQITFLFAWVWGAFAFMVVAMGLIYRALHAVKAPGSSQLSNPSDPSGFSLEGRTQEKSGLRRSFRDSWLRRGKSSTKGKLGQLKRQFAVQALLYCAVFCLTWLFYTLNWVFFYWLDLPAYVPMIFLQAILAPLQGFWNAFIYVRPRYLRYRRQQREHQSQQEKHTQEQQPRRCFLSKCFRSQGDRSAAQAVFCALSIRDDGDEEDLFDEELLNEAPGCEEERRPADQRQSTFTSNLTGPSGLASLKEEESPYPEPSR